MPTYFAVGIRASLASCELRNTLSPNISNCRQGPELKRDLACIQAALEDAVEFKEHPVVDDGTMLSYQSCQRTPPQSNKLECPKTHAAKFIGADADMPFYIVETWRKQHLSEKSESQSAADSENSPFQSFESPVNGATVCSDDSSLTSLGATPSPIREKLNDLPPVETSALLNELGSTAKAESGTLLEQANASPTLDLSTPEALMLDVELCARSFLPQECAVREGKQYLGKDLKIEVFINGKLGDVTIVHADERRRQAAQFNIHKGRFTGSRIHRQVQKPWIYLPQLLQGEDGSSSAQNEQRWNTVGRAHREESETRGIDKSGRPPPSAEFLTALAQLNLPTQIRGVKGLGVIDLVITAGRGKKHGPETSYLKGPTRLEDPNYSKPEKSFADTTLQSSWMESLDDLASKQMKQTGLPEVSAAARDASCVSLYQHDGTLQENPDLSKTKNSAELQQRKDRTENEFEVDGHIRKKSKTNDLLTGYLMPTRLNGASEVKAAIDLTKLGNKALPQTQTQTNLGENTRGNRLSLVHVHGTRRPRVITEKLISTLNQELPVKRDTDSLGSVLSLQAPVDSVRNEEVHPFQDEVRKANLKRPLAQTPEPIPDNTFAPLDNKRNNIGHDTRPAEKVMLEALETFQIPETCHGSCVTFSEEVDVCRHIPKARGGEFVEETFLVGMRFLVTESRDSSLHSARSECAK